VAASASVEGGEEGKGNQPLSEQICFIEPQVSCLSQCAEGELNSEALKGTLLLFIAIEN